MAPPASARPGDTTATCACSCGQLCGGVPSPTPSLPGGPASRPWRAAKPQVLRSGALQNYVSLQTRGVPLKQQALVMAHLGIRADNPSREPVEGKLRQKVTALLGSSCQRHEAPLLIGFPRAGLLLRFLFTAGLGGTRAVGGESQIPHLRAVWFFHIARQCGASVAEGRRDTGRGSQAGRWGPELAPPYPHPHPEGTLVVARWTESSVDEPATVQERPGVAPSGESSGVSRWLSCNTPSVAPDPLSPVFTPLPPRALTCGPCGRGSHLLPCGQAPPAGAPRAAGGERGVSTPACYVYQIRLVSPC